MIRFNFPHVIGTELEYLADAISRGRLSGDGYYTERCSELLKTYLNAQGSVLLTHSCTGALEMAAILADIESGDEIIMPSYTFVSTANAFVLRGGVPVFVDIRPDTLNIDESLIESAITPRTKAIVVVHYAGVACEMDTIVKIARHHGLFIIEDAAQALGSTYKGRKLGTIGDFAAFSFHETKNIISGEGGALVLNDSALIERAEIIREKGTNRSRFFRGEVDKYTWVDIGSSFLPSEIVAAFLFAQLGHIDRINCARREIWDYFFEALNETAKRGQIRLPSTPPDIEHNAHMFYFLASSQTEQQRILVELKKTGINAVFHYVPLHSSEAGLRFGRLGSTLNVTNDIALRLIRLPLYPNLTKEDILFIASTVKDVCDRKSLDIR